MAQELLPFLNNTRWCRCSNSSLLGLHIGWNHINSNSSFLLAKKQRGEGAMTPPLLANHVLPSHEVIPCPPLCLAWLSSKRSQGLAFSFWLVRFRQKQCVCEKWASGKHCFPQPDPISGQAIREHRRRFVWSSDVTPMSCNEHATPWMTGHKDSKQSQT